MNKTVKMWHKLKLKVNKCSIIWIKWYKIRKKDNNQNKMTYNWKSITYNWNKMHYNLNKCSIMWIKWYTSEMMSVKFIKNSYKWNKMT